MNTQGKPMTHDALDTQATPVDTGTGSLNEQFTHTSVANAQTIRDSVAIALNNYFSHLDGQEVFDVYDMVLAEVEAPLLEAVMKYTRKNQTKAATLLGLNRGTLRKKLKQYGML